MRKKISLILLFICLISCTSFSNTEYLEERLENSNNFNDILTLKYLRYSYVLKKNYDYKSASYFSKLAKQAYNRQKDFSLKIDDSLKDIEPEKLANLYFLFNCWLYFETNHKNLGEAAICKNSFIKEAELLEKRKFLTNKQKTVEVEEDQINFLTKNEELYYLDFAKNKVINLYFDFDNYKLNPESLAKVSSILKYINELKEDYKITITGHTDRIGKAIYNNTLARRRANTVYNIFIKNGVPKNLITVIDMSSKSPQVITRQNEKNQLNRRVEVKIDTGYRNQDMIPQPMKL